MNLEKLSNLWLASERNLPFRAELEAELMKEILENNKTSREYLFRKCIIEKHAIGISFVPTSYAYNNYGSHITVNVTFDDLEADKLTKNIFSNPPKNTYGQIKADSIVPDQLTVEQINLLKDIGFNTNEILTTITF